tara:strand:+ start:475 stop:780 length:306 start_codon:yes stop_codon:yes gene_type:complete
MERGLYNITSATTTTLIDKLEARGVINSINISNNNEDLLVYISLYLDDGTNQVYFFKKNLLHPGVVKFLNEGLSFNNNTLALKLKTEATTSSTVNVSVIIK